MKFRFQAKDQDGVIKEGIIEAVSEETAVQTLQRNNLVPLSIEQIKKTSAFIKELKRAWEGVTQKEMAIFSASWPLSLKPKFPLSSHWRPLKSKPETSFYA